MRRWFFISTVLLCAALIWAVLKAPAQIASNISARLFPELTLNGVSGTVWQGMAEQSSWKIGPSELPLGQLHWSVNWSRLLVLQPVVEIHTKAEGHGSEGHASESHSFEGQVEMIAGGVRLQQAQGQFPLALLEAWVPLLVSAEVKLNLQQLDYRYGRFTALTGFLSADQVTWEVGDYDMPLGDYQADVALLDEHLVLLIEDVKAALGANAEMRFSPEGQYQFNGVFTPRDHLAPEVSRVIGWLGRRDNNGQVIISQQGRWR